MSALNSLPHLSMKSRLPQLIYTGEQKLGNATPPHSLPLPNKLPALSYSSSSQVYANEGAQIFHNVNSIFSEIISLSP